VKFREESGKADLAHFHRADVAYAVQLTKAASSSYIGPNESVCLAEPSVPTAPLGGRLREADTRPCLVVSLESSCSDTIESAR
jgi:hypothetical protein